MSPVNLEIMGSVRQFDSPRILLGNEKCDTDLVTSRSFASSQIAKMKYAWIKKIPTRIEAVRGTKAPRTTQRRTFAPSAM
jgi:hypothetical protein